MLAEWPNARPSEPLWSVKSAAVFWGVRVRTVRRYIRRRLITFISINNSYRIPESQILKAVTPRRKTDGQTRSGV